MQGLNYDQSRGDWYKLNNQVSGNSEIMKKRKSILQKTSNIIGIICFLLAVLCAVALYFKFEELGMQHPVTASFLASSFFFVFIGFVFSIMGNANIPDFNVTESSLNEGNKTRDENKGQKD